MRSGTSCFNFTVWRKTFLRFWPVWTVNLVCWLLMLPLPGLMRMDDPLILRQFYSNIGNSVGSVLTFALAFGLIAAMAAFSHLYSARSANFIGSLPPKREAMFVSHYLAGLSMLLLPNLAVLLLTLLVQAAGNAFLPVPLLFWLGCLCAEEFFFYSFAVCLGMFAGHILALPVFYGIFNIIVLGVYQVGQWILSRFFYGWAHTQGTFVDALVEWLTPAWRLSNRGAHFYFHSNIPGDGSYTDLTNITWEFEGGGALAVYAAVGVVLTVCALLLYRKRHLETAGDVVGVPVMRPVFRYGVAVCAGLFLGAVTSESIGLPDWGLAVSMLLWAAAGCFAAQMILDKTFKVFHKWKGTAAVVGVFLVMIGVMAFDLTGYETRVPDPASVSFVEITGLQSTPYDDASIFSDVRAEDPETIRTVTELHQAAVERRDEPEGGNFWWSFDLTYHLADGSTMRRSYSIYDTMNEPDGEVLQLVSKLQNDPSLLYQACGFAQVDELLAEGGRLVEVSVSADREVVGYREPSDGPATASVEEENVKYFSGVDAQDLWEAVRADFEDGGYQRYNGYFQGDGGTVPAEDRDWWVVTMRFDFERSGGSSQIVNMIVQDTARRTIETLRALGIQP